MLLESFVKGQTILQVADSLMITCRSLSARPSEAGSGKEYIANMKLHGDD